MTRGDTRRALGTLGAGLRQLLGVRWIRWSLALVLLLLTARLTLEWLVATTVDRLAAQRDLVCEWEDLDVSVLSLRGEVRQLVVRSLPEGDQLPEKDGQTDPLLTMEYALFDLDVLKLLKGEIRIARAEVDGLDSRWVREADGSWNLGQHVQAAELLALIEGGPQAETKEDPVGEGDAPGPIDLSLPIAIEALRFQHARCVIVDRTYEPPRELGFELSAALSNLDDSTRPTRFSGTILGGDLFDAAHLEGNIAWSPDEIVLALRAQAGSIRPRELAHYLEPLDIRPSANSLEANLRGSVRLAVQGEARDSLSARAELTNIHLMVDGDEALALDRFVVTLESLSAEGARLPGIEVAGIRGRASLEPDSALRIAGLDVTGLRWLESLSKLYAASDETDASGFPRWLALLFEEDANAYPWSLDSLEVHDGLLDFTDRTVAPEASFPLHIDSVVVGEVAHVPGTKAKTIPVQVDLRAPGMAERIELAGSVGPFAPRRSIDLDLRVDGIVLASLEEHFQRVGVERALQSGSFQAHLSGEAETDRTGRTVGQLSLDRVNFADGQELFGVERISATELLFDPATRLLRLGNLEISGTQLAAGRDESKYFFAFGLRTLGFTPEAPSTSGALPPEEASRQVGDDVPVPAGDSLVPPRIELGRLVWSDNGVEFVDRFVDPPRRFAFDELGLELTDLTLGGAPEGPEHEPARFTARAVAPGILEELTAEGRIRSNPGPVDLSLEIAVRAQGGDAALFRPYLRTLGIEPTFVDAEGALDLQAQLKQTPEGWRAGLSVKNAVLREGAEELLACEELRIDDVRLGERIEVGTLALVGPRAAAGRDAEGTLVLTGVRWIGSPPAREESSERAPAALSLPTLPKVLVKTLDVADARLAWTDLAWTPVLATELVIDASAQGFNTEGKPGTFRGRLHVPENLGRLEVAGSVTVGPAELSLAADVEGEGVRPGPLARLLPSGVELVASEGRLTGSFEASVEPASVAGSTAPGGLQVELGARDLVWGEEGSEPWLALGRADLKIPRIDPLAGRVVVGPVVAQGLTLDVSRDSTGTLHLLGLAFGGASPAESTPAEAEPAGGEETEPVAPAPPLVLPRIELADTVRLELERLSYRDASLGAEALPVELGATLRLGSPVVIVAPDPEEAEPLDWEVAGSLTGLVKSWSARGQVSLFAPEPTFDVRVAAQGIRTAGLVERLPRLAGRLEGEVEEGTFAAALNGSLFVRRARATELGLSRPFGAELTVRDVEYRDATDGLVLAGVDEVTVEVQRIDTAQGLVHLDNVVILRPRGVARRRAATVHALGLALHLDGGGDESVPAEEPATPVEAAAPTEAATIDEEPGEPEKAGAPGFELRVDQLVASGLDFELVDETPDPHVRIPLTELDAEVTRFTTRALVEDHPIQFSGYLGSGSGEKRVFGEVAATGRIALYPEPSGWTQLSMTGLELLELAPLAAMQGLTIEDGALDASARLRFQGSRGATVDSTLVFTDLDLQEPEGGLLQRTLSLPVGLDSALFLLKNADGEHRFSTGFTVDEGGLSLGQMAAAGSRAFTEVLARALAAVPMRLLSGLVPGSKKKPERTDEAWTIAFWSGTTETVPGIADDLSRARLRLEASRSHVLVLRHELTAGDVERARTLANPSDATCRELVQRLRQQKAALLRAREATATDAFSLYTIGDERARRASETLREQERELASIEDALDSLLEVLRSDSPRQREKRTRSAAREIAEQRLDAVEDQLRAGLSGSVRERIEIRPPRFEVADGDGGGRVVIELRKR